MSKRGSLIRHQRGGVVLKILLGVPTVLLLSAIAWYVYADQRLKYWDNRVKELCEKDGQGVVFERVVLGTGEKNPPTPDERYADAGATYVSRWSEEVIRSGDPKVVKTIVAIVRGSDKKILGHQIVYARTGGDVGFVDNPSVFSCRDIGVKSIGVQIFSEEWESK